MKVVYVRDTTTSTRTKTPEGFLRGRAAITRPGIIEYDAGDIGIGEKGQKVKVLRTDETVFHPETIANARGTVITLGHPDDVTPQNWKEHAVGSIAGEVAASRDRTVLEADIVVSDAKAIDELEGGKREVSVAYDFSIEPATPGQPYDYRSIGPMRFNHMGIVENGRSGDSVRVYDEDRDVVSSTKESDMPTIEELKAAMEKVLDERLPAKATDGLDKPTMARIVMDAMTPVLDAYKEQETRQAETAKAKDEAEKAAASDKLKKESEEAANKLIEEVRTTERRRYALLQDALPLIPEEKRAGATDMDERTIMLAALGETVGEPEGKTDDYLRGALSVMQKERTARQSVPMIGRATDSGSSSRVVDEARDAYIKSITEAHKQPFSVQAGK